MVELLQENKPRKAVSRTKTRGDFMHVGVPEEVKSQEFRVGVTPGAVREFARDGHLITVETGAGLGIGATDDDYRRSGAQVVA